MRFGALLFDLDGTLVDSHHEICLALDKALVEVGFALDFARVAQLVDGSPLDAIWEQLQDERVSQSKAAEYERFAQAYRQHYMRDLGQSSALFPDVRGTLEDLRAMLAPAGFSIVSNKSAASVLPLLVRFGIDHCFDLALGCGGTQIQPKPHPELLLHAASRLGIAPARCLMVGDTALDIEAGKRAGMSTVAVTHGMASREQLLAAGADHLIDSFADLRAIALA